MHTTQHLSHIYLQVMFYLLITLIFVFYLFIIPTKAWFLKPSRLLSLEDEF